MCPVTGDNSAKKMSDTKKPLELAFDTVALDCGGSIVSELHPYLELKAKGHAPNDADYFFPAHNVVAELKRLEKDTFDPVDDPRIRAMTNEWIAGGLIPPPENPVFKLNLRELPEACANQAMRFFSKRIQDKVVDANRQIKKTKETLQLTDATKGLLLVASDGNGVLYPESVVILLARIFKAPHYSSIHSVIYFNYTVVAESPSLDSNVLFWIDSAIRDGGVPRQLMRDLERRWSACLQDMYGRRTLSRVQGDEPLLADLRFKKKDRKK